MTSTGDDPAAAGHRRRPRLDEVGEEPDARFSFANERTFLAWIRTALGCVVAGLAVAEVLGEDDTGVAPRLIGAALILLGGLFAFTGYGRWEAAERAMRLGEPLPRSLLPRAASILTVLLAVVAVVYTLR